MKSKARPAVEIEGALSDCRNWNTNSLGDCGGRLLRKGRSTLCETCLDRLDTKKNRSKKMRIED